MEFIAQRFDFSKTEGQAFLVHSVRLVFIGLVLLITLSFQFLESRIDAGAVYFPLYILIGFSLVLQIGFFSFFKSLHKQPLISGFLLFFEAIYITGLIYFIGIQQSILIFLYLVNLILAGILFQRKGALSLALWTSILFSFIVSLDTRVIGNTAYLAVGVNNLAFFTVAYLSGYLSEQLNIMGEQLEEKVRDVQTLKNLNDLILKNINSGLVTIDNVGNILQANPAARRFLQLEIDKLDGVLLSDVLPELDVRSCDLDKEFDLSIKKRGETRILRIVVNGLHDDENRRQGSIVGFQDETVLKALEKRVRQSEKMAAIGQLAAGIAHEIRNPLAGISGSIQLMQADDSDVEQSKKLMNIVIREIDRLNNLISEFLDFAKPESPMEDHIALGSLLEESLQLAMGPSSQLKTEVDLPSELKILGNRDKLKQAFLNILVNACQAIEDHGDGLVRMTLVKNGDFAWVSIADNGVGMSEELRDRIFEPFHTTKHKGTGLGLAITHSILEAHGAQIQVESEVGRGTEFKIRFKTLAASQAS